MTLWMLAEVAHFVGWAMMVGGVVGDRNGVAFAGLAVFWFSVWALRTVKARDFAAFAKATGFVGTPEDLVKLVKQSQANFGPTPRVEPQDPIHEHDGKWWFWDEVWANRVGPYNSRQEASEALDKYGASL